MKHLTVAFATAVDLTPDAMTKMPTMDDSVVEKWYAPP
jgi:hypothetical protein